MKIKDVANTRLFNQQISSPRFKTVKELVKWMGAMQAQDYGMAKWAIGIRLPGSTDKVVEDAINNGDIIRTHIMRPTWHFISADDIYWMLDLTASRIKSSFKGRHKEMELSDSVFKKTNSILEKSLRGGNYLTREELVTKFEKAGVATNNNRASHIFAHAELEKLICSGKIKNGKQTYALLEERVTKAKLIAKDEALAKIARTYFTSRTPATLEDFVWWSGLSVSDAKWAIDFIKDDFSFEKINFQMYLIANSSQPSKPISNAFYLLPAFDEFIISYTNRDAVFLSEEHKKIVTTNGIFRPIIVSNGEIIGTWSRTIKKDKVSFSTEYFKQPGKSGKLLIAKSVTNYSHFLGKEININTDS